MEQLPTNGDIPKFMKLLMIFIDRVGFPTMAFLLMFYLCNSTLKDITKAMAENTVAMNKLTAVVDKLR